LTAAAAAVLLVAGVVLALRDGSRDSLEPSDLSTPTVPVTVAPVVITDGVASTSAAPETTTAPTATSEPSTTTPAATVTSVAPGSSVPAATTPPATSVAPATTQPSTVTTPATTSSTAPPSTTEPSQPVPPASFRLTVRRTGERLVFRWPVYAGPGGQRYVLVQVGPAGLTSWPPPPSRIATVVYRIDADTVSLHMPSVEPRRWVLAVLGADRRLLAVSDPVASS
ncbi:MAG: hypothetical protein Q8M22_14045, partial [Actinomycetota bacterium]|nr:hypothetical protein [Actinomycetota bacterium]